MTVALEHLEQRRLPDSRVAHDGHFTAQNRLIGRQEEHTCGDVSSVYAQARGSWETEQRTMLLCVVSMLRSADIVLESKRVRERERERGKEAEVDGASIDVGLSDCKDNACVEP